MYYSVRAQISFNGELNVTFSHNDGVEGGAFYLEDDGGVLFNGSTSVRFSAVTGGAIYA